MAKTLLTTVPGKTGAANFNVVLVRPGDNYGRDDVLTNDNDETLVEFYDARYPHTEFGQFVSRYCRSTLLEDRDISYALALYGREEDWVVSAEGMEVVKMMLAKEAA